MREKQTIPHLPPLDAWKVDPTKLRKFYAPVDDRGFVLPDETVEMVQDLFEDDYEWPIDPRDVRTRPDVHHFHWMRRLYVADMYQGRSVPQAFRELPSVKGVLPRQFHNVLHAVTLPPNQPRYKDMEKHVHAYQLARRLFRSAQNASLLQHRFSSRQFISDSYDEVANEILIQKFDRQFRGYRMNIETIMDTAGLDVLRLDIQKFEKRRPNEMVKLLGSLASQQAVNFVPRFKTVA